MSNVTGQIGNDNVILENAATEATLRLILQATLATTKEQRAAIADLAKKAGIDEESILRASAGLTNVAVSGGKTSGVLQTLASAGDILSVSFNIATKSVAELTSGSAKVSNIIGLFGQLDGPIGAVANGLNTLVKFQENMLTAYRNMTTVGLNFAGSLVDIKNAQVESRMSLEEYSNFVRSNTKTFSLMGKTVDEGYQSFRKINKELITGNVGDNLRDLGFTSAEISTGLSNYIQLQGGLSAKQQQDYKAVAEAAGQYMSELDLMTKLMGQSRKQQEDAQKQLQNDAVFQQELVKMRNAGRIEEAKQLELMATQAKQRGPGAFDNFMAALTGTVPLTEAGRKWAAINNEAANIQSDMVKRAQAGKLTDAERRKAELEMVHASANAARALGTTGTVLARQDSEVGRIAAENIRNLTLEQQKGLATEEGRQEALDKAVEEQKKSQKSQADAAIRSEQALLNLGTTIMAKLSPILDKILPPLNAFITKMIDAVAWIVKHNSVLIPLVAAIGGLTAVILAYKAAQFGQKIATGIAGIASGQGLRGFGNLGTKLNPMYVIVLNELGGKGLGGLGSKIPGGGGKLGKVMDIGTTLLGAGIGTSIVDSIVGEMGVGKKEINEAQDEKNWQRMGILEKTESGLARSIEHLGDLFGASNLSAEARASRIKSETEYLKGRKEESSKEPPKLAEGGIATKETKAIVGDAGPEAIIPLDKLMDKFDDMNKHFDELIHYVKVTADNTKRNVDATRSLNGNLWSR